MVWIFISCFSIRWRIYFIDFIHFWKRKTSSCLRSTIILAFINSFYSFYIPFTWSRNTTLYTTVLLSFLIHVFKQFHVFKIQLNQDFWSSFWSIGSPVAPRIPIMTNERIQKIFFHLTCFAPIMFSLLSYKLYKFYFLVFLPWLTQ